ncbi:MAG: hypothetical protein HY901_00965 [Deltaproteobacteria bacterium]|nr:hypothetical protein [Deltaproteobacteria bacterium]
MVRQAFSALFGVSASCFLFSCGSAQVLPPPGPADASRELACTRNFQCPADSLCIDGSCVALGKDAGSPADAAKPQAGPDAQSEADVGSTATDVGTGGPDAESVRPDASQTIPPDASACQRATCASLGVECGSWDDGCGGDLICGDCTNASTTCEQGHCVSTSQLDCSGISSHSGFELCVHTDEVCAGVFTNGAGCTAFCAAAGLSCVARYGGDTGCQKEAQNIFPCADDNGHLSDWCECGSGVVVPPDPTCSSSASNPPRQLEIHYEQATYQNRSAWVLECRDYAYTAYQAEHEQCDPLYQSGSGRGSASFFFTVPRGRYDVFLVGRHTANRNSAGALVRVRSDGTEHTGAVNQRDEAGIVADLVGNYCLGGNVEVMLDSTVNAQSDSVQWVRLVPNP